MTDEETRSVLIPGGTFRMGSQRTDPTAPVPPALDELLEHPRPFSDASFALTRSGREQALR